MNYIPFFFITIGGALGFFLFSNPRLAIWVLIFTSMVLSGTIIYFAPRFGTIQWGNVIISLLLFVRAIADSLRGQKKPEGKPPAIFIFMVLFLIHAIITSIANYHLKESGIASKNLFQFWGVPFVLYFLVEDEKIMSSYMKSFVLIAVLMPPLALYQFRYFGGLSHDAVTGTFGGAMRAGGPNAVLSIFIISQLAVLFALALRKMISWRIAVILCGWVFITITLTNAKAAVGFLVIMPVFLLSKGYLRFSFSALIVMLLAILMSGIMFLAYYQYSQERKRIWTKPPKSYSEFIDRAISDFSAEESNRLNRSTLILLWWKYNINTGNNFQMLFGHGLGASKYSGLSMGHIQKRFGELKIGRTALTALLWDVGIVGVLLFMSIFTSGFLLARRMKNDWRLPAIHQVFMLVAQLNCLFFVLSLPYKLSIINIQAFNFFSMFTLGYVCYWQRRLRAIESNLLSEATSASNERYAQKKTRRDTNLEAVR